jgi:hypothetical protein
MSFTEPIKQTKETKKLYDHIQWLNANASFMTKIHETRMNVLIRILKKMRDIKTEYDGFNTNEYQAMFTQVQLFSYFMSSDWTDFHAYKHMQQIGAKKPWNLFYYIVHSLIKSDSFKWVAPNGEIMHAFHTNGKQDTYFHCEWDETTVQTMAAAAQDEGKAWTSQLWLARKMVSVYKGRNEFIPLERFVPISMTECWQPGTFKLDEELEETDVPLKQPDLWYYHPEKKIELFKTVISDVYNDLVVAKLLHGMGLIEIYHPNECRNIIIIIMLLEHELIHAYIAREDQSENLDITENDELAIPASFPRYQWMKWSGGRRPRNLGTPLSVWPKNKWLDSFTDDNGVVKDPGWRLAEGSIAPAYTNSAGHGDYFCRFTNLIFGHCGCCASTDTVQFKKKCEKKTWCTTYEKLVGSSTDGDTKMSVDFKLKLVF